MAVVALFVGVIAGTASAKPKADKGNAGSPHKIVICHRTEASRTGAEASPAIDDDGGWVLITISRAAWDAHHGHESHHSWKWGVDDEPAIPDGSGGWTCGNEPV